MIVTQTPLRISFAGGGTDFKDFWAKHGGAVVSTAIDKYIHVVVKERFDDLIVLNYSSREIVNSVDDIKHDLIRECMRKTGVTSGVEITTLADIPSEGSGLGSSSCVTVGLLHALYAFNNELITHERLAQDACDIEINILGAPIGIQDQYIAAYGGIRFFEFQKDCSVQVRELPLTSWEYLMLSSRIMLFFTDKTRKASSILSEQKDNIEDKTSILINMRDMASNLFEMLNGTNLDYLGEMLHKGWVQKKELASNISNPEINEIYDIAKHNGAVGGKISGAGGGGFMLLYVPVEHQDKVRKALCNLRELPFSFEPDGSKVIFNQRRQKWNRKSANL